MDDRKKQSLENAASENGEQQSGFLHSGWSGRQTLIPIPLHNGEHQYRHAPLSPCSIWQEWVAWLRYHIIQSRWDIERKLARLLHRRWGG